MASSSSATAVWISSPPLIIVLIRFSSPAVWRMQCPLPWQASDRGEEEDFYGGGSGWVEARTACEHLPNLSSDLFHIPPPDSHCTRWIFAFMDVWGITLLTRKSFEFGNFVCCFTDMFSVWILYFNWIYLPIICSYFLDYFPVESLKKSVRILLHFGGDQTAYYFGISNLEIESLFAAPHSGASS